MDHSFNHPMNHSINHAADHTYQIEVKNVQGHEVPLVTFPLLEQTGLIRAAFTTRQGGVSSGPYAQMNLGLGNEDARDNIRENYRIAAQAMGCTEEDVVLSQQTHTTNVRVVTAEDRGKGTVRERDYRDIDALITNVPGLLLTTLHADCTPLYFVDPVHRAIGLAHSGWRGTADRMGACTLAAMREAFGTNPADVLAVIGPVISVRHYEIGPEVGAEFTKTFGEVFCYEQKILTPGQGDRLMLDLEQANRQVLMQAGILPEHLAVSGLCTFEHADQFFSHRAVAGGKRGNCAAMMCLI